MNFHQQLMTITMEECGELVQVCSKMMRKFETKEEALADNPMVATMRAKMIEEVGDVMCMIDLMIQHGYLTSEEINTRISEKMEKLKKWSDLT
jgi:NTP pyrophosphatase (non-canonical NTP hydrolase)